MGKAPKRRITPASTRKGRSIPLVIREKNLLPDRAKIEPKARSSSTDSLSDLNLISSDVSFNKIPKSLALTKNISQPEAATLKDKRMKPGLKAQCLMPDTIRAANRRSTRIKNLSRGLSKSSTNHALKKHKRVMVEIPKNKINLKKATRSSNENHRQRAAFIIQRFFRLWMLHKANQELRILSEYICQVTRQALDFQKHEAAVISSQALIRGRLVRHHIYSIRAACEATVIPIQSLVRARLARQRVAAIQAERKASVILIQKLMRAKLLNQHIASFRLKRNSAARVLQMAWMRLKYRRAAQHRAAGAIQTFFRMVIVKAAFLRGKLQQAVDSKDTHLKGILKNNRSRSCVATKSLPDVITELNTMRNARCLRPVTFIEAGTRCPENIKAVNAEPNNRLLTKATTKVRFGDSSVIIDPDPMTIQPALPPFRRRDGPSILKNSTTGPLPLSSTPDNLEPLRVLRFLKARPQRENSHKGAYSNF
ncbi:hypothetical protein DSO57_1018630 [Entomophthora muscae]|uniref:Uncharacterized protein n=1 Tax=Entomophthora muscae TaxID=34485 RepID=A0ACC2TSA5_9FUNG|nr:hypothetical protein DSO57_1018630 [Entomophthora muscae]